MAVLDGSLKRSTPSASLPKVVEHYLKMAEEPRSAYTARVLAAISWNFWTINFEQILSISARKLCIPQHSGACSSSAILKILDLICRRRSSQLTLFDPDCSATKSFFSSSGVPARRARREKSILFLVSPLTTSRLLDVNASSASMLPRPSYETNRSRI